MTPLLITVLLRPLASRQYIALWRASLQYNFALVDIRYESGSPQPFALTFEGSEDNQIGFVEALKTFGIPHALER